MYKVSPMDRMCWNRLRSLERFNQDWKKQLETDLSNHTTILSKLSDPNNITLGRLLGVMTFQRAISKNQEDLDSCKKRLAKLARMLGKLACRQKQIMKLCGQRSDICAPCFPLPGTRLGIAEAMYNRNNRSRGCSTQLMMWTDYDNLMNSMALQQWRIFALRTRKIPLLLMEENAIEAHIFLMFKTLLPGDVAQILTGLAVRACAQTRAGYDLMLRDHYLRDSLAKDDLAEWERVMLDYDRPYNQYQRRSYNIAFGNKKSLIG